MNPKHGAHMHACRGGHSVENAAAVLAFAINCRHISPHEFSTCQTVLSSCCLSLCLFLLSILVSPLTVHPS